MREDPLAAAKGLALGSLLGAAFWCALLWLVLH